MRYADAPAFRQALEQRLRDAGGRDGARIARDRTRVAFVQFLARLDRVALDGWLVKGGFALDLRIGNRARATRDLDLEWQGSDGHLAETLIEATIAVPDDFFSFVIERTSEIPGGGGHRYRVTASLAGRPFATFPLDVALGSNRNRAGGLLAVPALLSFAGIDGSHVRVLPLEYHVAEKLHAYTRRYPGDRPSSRVKDLIDLVLIAAMTTFDSDELAAAIAEVFSERAAPVVPRSLPTPPAGWARPYRVLAVQVGLRPELAAGHRRAAALLDPVLQGDGGPADWNPDSGTWYPRDRP